MSEKNYMNISFQNKYDLIFVVLEVIVLSQRKLELYLNIVKNMYTLGCII